MIRAILHWREQQYDLGLDNSGLYTLDFECPELEAELSKGGSGSTGYYRVELRGVEVLPDSEGDDDGRV